jgi:hypothetical protein
MGIATPRLKSIHIEDLLRDISFGEIIIFFLNARKMPRHILSPMIVIDEETVPPSDTELCIEL